MDYSKEVLNKVVVVTINISEASLNQSDDFKNYLCSIDDVKPPKLVLDMAKIKYMDSSFIGALVISLKNIIARGGDMALASVNEDVRSLFEITRLDQVFRIYDNKEQAIRKIV